MLRLANLEALEALLLKVSSLVQLFENRDPRFFDDLKKWLGDAEKMLANNRISVAAKVAASRGSLISLERGDVDGGSTHRRTTARRQREFRAVSLLRETADSVNASIAVRRGQVEEAERAMLQVVAVGFRLGLIPASDFGENHTVFLETTWKALAARPELASLVVHILGLLGTTDALVMLDRALAQYSAQ